MPSRSTAALLHEFPARTNQRARPTSPAAPSQRHTNATAQTHPPCGAPRCAPSCVMASCNRRSAPRAQEGGPTLRLVTAKSESRGARRHTGGGSGAAHSTEDRPQPHGGRRGRGYALRGEQSEERREEREERRRERREETERRGEKEERARRREEKRREKGEEERREERGERGERGEKRGVERRRREERGNRGERREARGESEGAARLGSPPRPSPALVACNRPTRSPPTSPRSLKALKARCASVFLFLAPVTKRDDQSVRVPVSVSPAGVSDASRGMLSRVGRRAPSRAPLRRSLLSRAAPGGLRGLTAGVWHSRRITRPRVCGRLWRPRRRLRLAEGLQTSPCFWRALGGYALGEGPRRGPSLSVRARTEGGG